MSEESVPNPYQPALTEIEARPGGFTWTQAIVFGVLVLMLLARGGLMFVSWTMQLLAGFDLSGNFYLAMFTKDAIYAVTALLGGLLLIFFHRIGWWAAMIHWCWYFANQVIVPLLGQVFGWPMPVRREPATFYEVAMVASALTIFALLVLLWRPIVRRCHGPTDRRLLSLVLSFSVCVVLVSLVNWWASVR